jgi:hypothetical protein
MKANTENAIREFIETCGEKGEDILVELLEEELFNRSMSILLERKSFCWVMSYLATRQDDKIVSFVRSTAKRINGQE